MREKYEATINELVGNIAALISLMVPVGIIYFYWNLIDYTFVATEHADAKIIFACIACVIAIPVHEALHGFGWVLTAGKSFKDYSYGVKLPLTFFIKFNGSMNLKSFNFGLLLPLFTLGVVPFLFGIISNSIPVLFFGSLMICGAGSDIAVFIRTIGHSGVVVDEGKTGVTIYEDVA